MTSLTSLRIATDFSEHAGHALQRAIMVCAQLKPASGVLVHAMESHRVRVIRDLLPVLAELEQHQQKEAETHLAETAEKLLAETGVDFVANLREGEASEAVLENVSADQLIVIGNRGAHSVRDLALGSTAERVVRKSVAPVLIVKRVPRDDYQKLLVAVDFSADSQAAVQLAQQLAPGTTLTLVHALPPLGMQGGRFGNLSDRQISDYGRQLKDKAEQKMDDLLKQCGLTTDAVQRVIEHGYAPQLIWEQAHGMQADLVVMGKHGHSPMRDWLIGSVTSHVLAECAADVLVVGDTN